MDFIIGLPPSQGRAVILVIIYRLSKYDQFIALLTNFTSQKLLWCLFRNLFVYMDPLFLSEFWQELHRLQGTRLTMSSAFQPQSDGQTEAINKCLEMYCRCFASDTPSTWFSLLPWAKFWYNTYYQHSSRLTPFEVVYGSAPSIVSRFIQDSSTNTVVSASFLHRDGSLSYFEGQFVAGLGAYED